jgi:hypothetical protein
MLIKQMIYVNITSREHISDLNYELMNKIYNQLFNKDKIYINDCFLENYYDVKFDQYIKMNDKIDNYYDLSYVSKEYMFQLRYGDIDSYIFGFLYSHPNYLCLKDLFPNFFSFDQIDLFGFSFGNEIAKMMESSSYFLNNIKYLMILCMLYIWFFLIFVLRIIYVKIIKEITEPIIRLTNIVNLNIINDINQNEDLFEYTLDEEINNFFLLCKKLVNGEIKNNDINIKNKVDSNNKTNNMIINNKMILELIENQKSLKKDKEIYLIKHPNSNQVNNSIIDRRRKTNKSSRYKNTDKSSLGLNLIRLNSLKNEKNLTRKEENFEDGNDNDKENYNMKYYENLLKLAEYIYNGKTFNNTNKNNQNDNQMKMNINHISTRRLVRLKSQDFSAKEKNEEEKQYIRKDCKYITYFWYINAKKNKLFDH